MMHWMLDHLIILPIVVPLLISSFLLLIDEKRRVLKASLSITALASTLVSMGYLLYRNDAGSAEVYLLGSWSAPFGIALVADALSVMMILLANLLGLAALLFSLARWDRAGPRFLPLFLLLMMGVNGVFLTGDIFNLFVFFEVMLAASYALLLHGSGSARVKSGLHYIAINLVASSLFLIGISLIYGVTGTLNMADLAVRVHALDDTMLLNVGLATLGIAFLIKAGMWPLGFWLPAAYGAAAAPAAAIFGIMTKIGVYSVLRLNLLLSTQEGNTASSFSDQWLFIGGILTLLYGAILVISSRTMSRVAAACVFMSSGTLLAVIGSADESALAGALFYLVSSTLAVGAFFLLIELINRTRGTNAPVISDAVFSDEYSDPYEDGMPDDSAGVITPAAVALVSGGFLLCALLLAGLPPMPSFIGKFAIMHGLVDEGDVPLSIWLLIIALTISSLFTLLAMVRLGIDALWVPSEMPVPRIAPIEFISIAGLLAVCIVLTFRAGDAMHYMEDTAKWLTKPQRYVNTVLNTEVTRP
jgi:multicomponent K+:H+ antiporter subunit D